MLNLQFVTFSNVYVTVHVTACNVRVSEWNHTIKAALLAHIHLICEEKHPVRHQQVGHVKTGSCTAELWLIGITTEMCRRITSAMRDLSNIYLWTYLADPRYENRWAKRTNSLPYARRNCATSGIIQVSTGRRVCDPELKRESVSGETVQTGGGKKHCEAVWSFVTEAILSGAMN